MDLMSIEYACPKGRRIAKATRMTYKNMDSGTVYISGKAIGQAAWFCALADCPQMLDVDNHPYIDTKWCKKYAAEIKDQDLCDTIETVERQFLEEKGETK